MPLCESIHKDILSGTNIVLIGGTDEGKTWFVHNELIPCLEEKGLRVKYFKDCNAEFDLSDNPELVIIDEVETLTDREFLEKRHPEEKTYYKKKYLQEVKGWHEKLKNINLPAIYIVTRSEKEEIDFLSKNLRVTDWGKPVKCIVFKR